MKSAKIPVEVSNLNLNQIILRCFQCHIHPHCISVIFLRHSIHGV